MNLTAGSPLQGGKYLLERVLSHTGLTVTFKASQTHLNKPVVLKMLRPNPQIHADFALLKQQFVEDVRQFARCQHPGFVHILDMFEEGGLPFVVMDFVAGQPLADRVQAKGPLPEAKALRYIRQVGSALGLIHRHGLVHRNVKPKNLIRPPGADFVVLVDFGGVTSSPLPGASASVLSTSNPYGAIEQYQSAEPQAATDVYALAASLYFLLTGQPPIAASQRHETPLVPPRQLQPQLSAMVEAAILSGMDPNSQTRPPTIAAWFSLLPHSTELPLIQVHQNGSTPPPPPSAKGNPPPSTKANDMSAAPATVPVIAASPSKPSPPKPPSIAQPSNQPLILASALALVMGVGAGLALRVSGATGPGSSIFHTEQVFPPVKDFPVSAESITVPVTSPSPTAAPVRGEIPPPLPPRSDVPLRAPIAPKPKPSPMPEEITPPALDSDSSSVEEAPAVPAPRPAAPPPVAPASEPVAPAQGDPDPPLGSAQPEETRSSPAP